MSTIVPTVSGSASYNVTTDVLSILPSGASLGQAVYTINMYENYAIRFTLTATGTYPNVFTLVIVIGDDIVNHTLTLDKDHLRFDYNTLDGTIQTYSVSTTGLLAATGVVTQISVVVKADTLYFRYGATTFMTQPFTRDIYASFDKSYVKLTCTDYSAVVVGVSIGSVDISNIYYVGDPLYCASDIKTPGTVYASNLSGSLPYSNLTGTPIIPTTLAQLTGTLPYSSITSTPTIPTTLSQLTGTLPYSSITGTPWTAAGSTTAASVGIGTTTPSSKLTVSGGDFRIENNGLTTMLINQSNYSGNDSYWKIAVLPIGTGGQYANLDIDGNFSRLDMLYGIKIKICGVPYTAPPYFVVSEVDSDGGNTPGKVLLYLNTSSSPHQLDVWIFSTSYSFQKIGRAHV